MKKSAVICSLLIYSVSFALSLTTILPTETQPPSPTPATALIQPLETMPPNI